MPAILALSLRRFLVHLRGEIVQFLHMLEEHEDAYGQEVLDYHRNPQDGIQEIVERDDGWIETTGGPAAYFQPYDQWLTNEQEAIAYAYGRVLDVGCGPGRVCLYLQKLGHDVVGIDNSPLAIQVARERGVQDARVMSITQVSRNTLSTFDAIVMFGNNFGLMANLRRARWLLRRFYHMTGADGRIIASSNDVYKTDEPDHLAYHERNRRRGRMPGQIRLRVRYKKITGPWFDYLMVSPDEMRQILNGTGWRVHKTLSRGNDGLYTAIIEKE